MSPYDHLPVHDSAEGALLPVLVQPRASRDRVAGVHDDRLKLQLTAPPVEGAANEACVRYLAKLLGVSRSAVVLKTGRSDRRKLFLIVGVSAEDVRARLDAGD